MSESKIARSKIARSKIARSKIARSKIARSKMARSKMARTDYRAKNKQYSGGSKGLIKKADELSQLCGANVYIVIQHFRTKRYTVYS